MVANRTQGASVAKNAATPMHPDDARFLGALTGAFVDAGNAPNPYASSGMLFAGPGAPSPIRDLGTAEPIQISGREPVSVTITLGPEPSGFAYGPSYSGALSTWLPSGLIDSTQIDLNAAAFRSSLNTTPDSSWDALTQQADARIAAGTYDRFSDLGHAIVDDGSFSQRAERFAHALTYTRPDAAEQIAAFRAPPNMTTATFDTMLSSPLAGMAGGLMYASGRSGRDAYLAATIAGSAEGIAAGAAGFQMPAAPQSASYASRLRSDPAMGGVARNGQMFEVVAEAPISGTTRSAHRAAANNGFAEQLRNDSGFAAQMNAAFGTNVLQHMESGSSVLRNPPSTEWHHPVSSPNTMWLLRTDVHRDPVLQDYLHSGNSGGFALYYGGK